MAQACIYIVVVAALVAVGAATHICGNYCGPTWCNGQVVPECDCVSGAGCLESTSNCAETGPTDGSCADACCALHDTCCGSADRTQCNNNFFDCLDACPQGPGSPGKVCEGPLGPVPIDLIKIGMDLFEGDCCGTACDGPVGTSCSWGSCSDCGDACQLQHGMDYYCCFGDSCCCYSQPAQCDVNAECPCSFCTSEIEGDGQNGTKREACMALPSALKGTSHGSSGGSFHGNGVHTALAQKSGSTLLVNV